MADKTLSAALGAYPVGATVPTARNAPDPRLLGLLAQLAAASTTAEIADAAVGHAVTLLGGRAGALALLSDGATRLDIVGAVGYGCGMMSAGSSLAADADLPITRAALTGRTVVEGGSWIATPLAPAPSPIGALLVSLAGVTEISAEAVALVEEIAAHARAAMTRLPRRAAAPAVVATHLSAAGVGVDVRLHPLVDPTGGDLVECWDAGDGSAWLLVADACGADTVAASTALAVAVTARAVSASASGPAALLVALDAALAATPRVERFVTAIAARVTPDGDGVSVVLASAGHPAPWVVGAASRVAVELTVESPLNLRLPTAMRPVECRVSLVADDRLVFFTDGALDRAAGSLDDAALAAALGRSFEAGHDGAAFLEDVCGELARAGGPSRDDMALATLRAPRTGLSASPATNAH